MCRRIECPKCKKPTYAGCGMHIEQVLGDIPKPERCRCNDKPVDHASKSMLERIFGR